MAAEPSDIRHNESNNGESSSSTNPINDFTVVEIQGEQVSLADLKQGYMKHADYTQKTQQLAEDRRVMEEELSDKLDQANVQGKTYSDALAIDIEWYNSNPREQWGKYQPRINDALGIEAPASTPNTTPAPKKEEPEMNEALTKDVKEVKDMLEDQRADRAKLEQEKAVDAVLDVIDSSIKENPLANRDQILDAIQAHQLSNGGSLPTLAQVGIIVEKNHKTYVNLGVPIPAGIQTQSSQPDVAPGAPAAQESPAHEALDLKGDSDKVEDALEVFISNLPSQQE